MEWIIPCNPELYDINTSINTDGFVYWRQNARYSTGDIVYIYVSGRVKRIQYKTTVVDTDIDGTSISDPYWLDKSQETIKLIKVKLKLLKSFAGDDLSFQNLRKNGLNSSIQGPMKLKGSLSEYVRSVDQYYRIVSFSCGPTYDLVKSTCVHAHPVKNGFPKNPTKWLMIRKNGGISEEVFEVVTTIDSWPDEVRNLTSYRDMIVRYADSRKRSYGFETKDKPYRFYILKKAFDLNPPYIMQPNLQGYRYYELDEIYHNKTESVSDNINAALQADKTIIRNDKEYVTCRRCGYQFIKAPRCPECGQLHSYKGE